MKLPISLRSRGVYCQFKKIFIFNCNFCKEDKINKKIKILKTYRGISLRVSIASGTKN